MPIPSSTLILLIIALFSFFVEFKQSFFLAIFLQIHKPSHGNPVSCHKIWAQSVQPFRRLLDTNKQADKQSLQTNESAKFSICIMNRCWVS